MCIYAFACCLKEEGRKEECALPSFFFCSDKEESDGERVLGSGERQTARMV